MPRRRPVDRTHGPGDPLAALLRAEEIALPSPAYRDRVRADLMARPPATVTPRPGRGGAWATLSALVAIGLLAGVVVLWTALRPGTDLVTPADPAVAPTALRLNVPTTVATRDQAPAISATAPALPAAASPVPVRERPRRLEARPPAPATLVPAPTLAAPADAPAPRRPRKVKPATPTVEHGDEPDVTPQVRGTATPRPPDPATPTRDGYPRPPATPTAAPTSEGVPTSIPALPTATGGAPPPEDRDRSAVRVQH